jgi:polysaccharide chain length determinant protein (PEP-CTERM system associated)
MTKRAPRDLGDYWEIFLRRRWWIVITALVIGVGTVVVASKLPKIYRSETTILVEPQAVPPAFVKPTVTTDITDRLQTISQEVLSRTSLEGIIEKFKLYQDEPQTDRILHKLFGGQRPTQEDLVELMQKDIDVENVVDPQSRQQNVAAFKISYKGPNPALVQQVTRELGSLFIEENLKVREHQAQGTDQFIDSQLEAARQDLEAQDKRLAAFKAAHMGALPEQEQANLQVLGQLQILMQDNADGRSRAEEQKIYFQSLLDALSKQDAGLGVTAQTSVETELGKLRAQLAVDEQRYKPEYPEIGSLQGQIKALESLQRSEAQPQTTAPPPTSAANAASLSQVRSQIAALDDEIKQRTKKQSEIEEKIKAIQARLETLPATEQQLSEVKRDYTISEANYQALLEKKNEAAMAADMEQRAEGEQFRVLDPASLPVDPYEPNLARIDLLGTFAGILCGCLLGLMIEFRDDRIRNQKDVTYCVASPLLASLPLLRAAQASKRRGSAGAAKVDFNLDLQPLPPSPGPEAPKDSPETSKPSPAQSAEPTTPQGSPSSVAFALHRALALEGKALPWLEARRNPQRTMKLEGFPEHLLVSRLTTGDRNSAFAGEQFRILRTRLLEVMRARRIRTLMVTSAVEGEGKTLVATNLAFMMSRVSGLRVLLVDADLRRAGLARFLGAKPPHGLATYLQNGKGLADVCWQVNDQLSVVPTPSLWDDSARLLGGDRMRRFLQEALADHELVIVDAPPLLPVADAQALTSLVDGAVMVIRSGHCPFELAASAAELLQPKLVGVILNSVESVPRKRYYYEYYNHPETNDGQTF